MVKIHRCCASISAVAGFVGYAPEHHDRREPIQRIRLQFPCYKHLDIQVRAISHYRAATPKKTNLRLQPVVQLYKAQCHIALADIAIIYRSKAALTPTGIQSSDYWSNLFIS